MNRKDPLLPIDKLEVHPKIIKLARKAYEMGLSEGKSIRALPTGCSSIDDTLKGGIPISGITEISGESGSGKTQLALQLAVRAVLPVSADGLDTAVAYICTESQFPVNRLQQILSHVDGLSDSAKRACTDRIYVHHIADMDLLVDCICYQLPSLITKQKIGVVIIDSVAAPFRVAEVVEQLEKTKQLQVLGYRLHKMSFFYNVVIIAINQVTSTMNKRSLYGTDSEVTPALGLAWANLITSRLMVSKLPSFGEKTVKRSIEVLFCPWLPKCISANFCVCDQGIKNT